MQNLWAEIRRRNLHRVTAGYAVVAWVLFQGAGLAFPAFAMPDWAFRLLVILLIAGLPILWVGLWLAHPEAEQAPTAQRPLHHTEWVLIGLLGLVLVAALGEFGYSQFKPATAPSTSAAGPQDASIAVLAFNNMSDDAKNEYFSDGISEELLNDLAQVQGLRVAGRTSSFSFKGKSATIEDIGKALNVHTVLEGSVQRAGDRVRITAQLINAANDFHIWSQTYDREISDIFAVEDEISHTITHELTGRLLGTKVVDEAQANPVPAPAQINPDAYTAYLQGRFYFNKRNKADMERAIEFFKQAIKQEPNYVDAHASLALAYALLYGNGQRRDTLEPAQGEIATALRLDPDNSQAIVAKGFISVASWDWQGADAMLRKAISRNPNDVGAYHFYGDFLSSLNLQEAAIVAGRRALVLDPLAAVQENDLGFSLHYLNRNAESAAAYKASLALDPNFALAMPGLCQAEADLGKLDEAKKLLHDRLIAVDGEDGPFTDTCRVFIAAGAHEIPELQRLAAAAPRFYASGDMSPSNVAFIYALAGDLDQAIRWFEKACDERDGTLVPTIADPDLPTKLKADPRWAVFMQRPLLKDWQAAHDRVTAELATASEGR